jgi:hypothetical protein
LSIVNVDLGRAGLFVEYYEGTYTFVIQEGADGYQIGNFMIVIQLVDLEELVTEYTLILDVSCPDEGDGGYIDCYVFESTTAL